MEWSRRQVLRIGLATLAGGISATTNAASEESPLLAGLLRAHERKMNEDARYTVFAQKADEEKYSQVAALFRAAAASAKVNMRSQASLIKELGGTPKSDAARPDVASTKDNLAVALKDESYEVETTYPELIKAAQDGNMGLAERILTYTKSAITEHVKLYRNALDHLEQREEGGKVFYVCPECGIIALQIATEVCPICRTPKAMFERIG